MEQLSKNAYVKTGTRGCNPGCVVTSEGVVLIDVPGDIAYIDDYIKEIAKWGKVLYIITTEYHFDHNMTNAYFDAPIIASEITRAHMPTNSDRYMRFGTRAIYEEPMEIPTQEQYRQGYPTITFSDRMTLKIGAHTFQIMLLPGHTAGQTSVYVPEEKVLFASDNVSSMGGASMHDAKPYKWLESLQYMKRLDVDCIATGHGDVITSDPESYIDQQASAVRARIEVVEKAKAEGTRVGELAEQWDEMFPPGPRPASEGFTITRKTKSDSSGKATSRGNALYTLNHLYQVIGGNNGS